TVHAPTISAATVGPQLVVLRTESGVLAEVEVFVNARYGYEVGCEVVGESGTVSLPPPIAVTTRSAGLLGSAVPADWRPRFADAYREELTAWVRDVAAGTATGPSAWDGY